MSVTIQLRRDTAANWTSANPVLYSGEAGLETDTARIKFGNGATAWNSLSYFTGGCVPLAGGTMTGQLTVPDVAASGLTGATAASRYVGATASGAPASGTFAVGDFVIDQTAKIWVCTTAGTPGTWTQVGGGAAPQVPYLPSDDGMLAVSWDPAANSGGSGAVPSSVVILIRMDIRAAMSPGHLVISKQAAGAGSSSGSFAGLYRVSGTSLNLLTGSSDIGSSLTSAPGATSNGTGLAFTSAPSLNPGDIVYGALLSNLATSQPSLYLGPSGTTSNNGVAQVWPRVTRYVGSGSNTSLPTSGTITTSNIDYSFPNAIWMGLAS